MTADVSTLVPLVSVALKATLLLALAAILDFIVLRRASAAARHQMWTFAVVGVLVLPALVWTLPSWRAAVPGIAAMRATDRTREANLTPPREANDAIDNDVVASVQPTPSTPRSPVTRTVPSDDRASFAPRLVSWTRLILIAYVAGALLLLARVIGEQFYVRRLARQAGSERDHEWTALLDATAARLGIRRRIGLLRSSERMMPITWGIVRPFVMVPAGSSKWPAARREAILVHELSHVARHDCLTQTLAAVACAVYWPHPGVWYAANRLRVERELACDDQVVTGGIEARDYAGHLLEIARTLHPPRQLAALAVGMATASHIEMRLRAAIDGTRRRTPPTLGVRLMSATAAAVLVLPVAAFRVATVQAVPNVHRLPRVFITALAPVEQPVAQGTLGGVYDIRLADPAEAGLQGVGTVIHISMFTPGLNTFYVPLSRFDGLSVAQLEAVDIAAQFTLRRGPGTFTFTGTLRRGEGKGSFTFASAPAFSTELVKRGMQPPTDEQQFTLARHGVGLEMLDELAAQGYATPTTAALVRASSSGPELDELRALATLGYTFGTLESVTRFHSSGVSTDYIRTLGTAGYRRLTPSELMQAQSHSVTAEFAKQANARAGRRLSISELVSLRSREEASTTESPSNSTANTPGTNATPPVARVAAEPTALAGTWTLANTRGPELELGIDWDGSNQWARRINAPELHGLPATAATTATPAAFRLEQDAGVFEFEGTFQSGRGTGRFRFQPNHSFAATVRSLGVRDVDDLSDHELMNLAFSGMSAAAIRELMALGVMPLTRRDLVDLAVRQVTPAYVRGLRAAGLAEGTPVADIIELRFIGVTPAYVKELTRNGDRKLTSSQVLDLWRARR